MLSARDQHGYTPAHWAALDGSVAVMRYLLERGAPIDLSCLGTQVKEIVCYWSVIGWLPSGRICEYLARTG